MINESNKNLLKFFPVLKQIPESEFGAWASKYLTPMETVIASYMGNIIYTNRGIGYTLPDGYIWDIKTVPEGINISIIKGNPETGSHAKTDVKLIFPEIELYSVYDFNEYTMEKMTIEGCTKSQNASIYETYILQPAYKELAKKYKIPYVFTNHTYNLRPDLDPRIEINKLCRNAEHSIDKFILEDSKKIPDMINEKQNNNTVLIQPSGNSVNNNSEPIPTDSASIPVSIQPEPELMVNAANGSINPNISLMQVNNNLRKIEAQNNCNHDHEHTVLDLVANTVRRNGFNVVIEPTKYQKGLFNVWVMDQNNNLLYNRSFIVDGLGVTLDPRPKWYPIAESQNMPYQGMVEFGYPAYALTNKKGEYIADRDISSFINLKYAAECQNYRRLYTNEEMSVFSWFAYGSLLKLALDNSIKIKITKSILKILTNSDIQETIKSVQDIPFFNIKEANSDKFVIVSEKSKGSLHKGAIEIIYDEKEKGKVCMNIL